MTDKHQGCCCLHDTPPSPSTQLAAIRSIVPGRIDPRRRALLEFIPHSSVGVEIGVFCGEFSESVLLACRPKCLHLVDPWWVAFGSNYPDWGGYTDFGKLETATAFEMTLRRVEAVNEVSEVHLHADYSVKWLETLPDEYLDWAYIDSSHSYEDTVRELQLLKNKVKKTGLIMGDDFQIDPQHEHYGVFRAVQEFVRSEPYDIIFADRNMQWVLRRDFERKLASKLAPVAERAPELLRIPYLRKEHVSGATLHASRYDLLRYVATLLPSEPVVVELGVALGDFTKVMFEVLKPKHLVALDIFTGHEYSHFFGKTKSDVFGDLSHQEYFEIKLSPYRDKLTILAGDGVESLLNFPDEFFDLIYVDAAHDYNSVLRDTEASIRKTKNSGIIIFNDYVMFDWKINEPYGIVPIVNDLIVNKGWQMLGFALHPELFCDVALRRG
jgi:predicted O-methyltransferase YrrM